MGPSIIVPVTKCMKKESIGYNDNKWSCFEHFWELNRKLFTYHRKLLVPLGFVILSLKSKNTPLFINYRDLPFTISLSLSNGSLFFFPSAPTSAYLPIFLIYWYYSTNFRGLWALLYSSISYGSIYCFCPIFALP